MHLLFGIFCYFFSALIYAQSSLVLTEYVEGTGYNKALEITNFGTNPLDLAAVKIQILIMGVQEQGTVNQSPYQDF